MGKHRTRLKILANILSVVSENKGVKRTQIMYQAYLSYNLLIRYLTDLTDSRLIICKEDKTYSLTEKGEHFLKKFNKYCKNKEIINEQLRNVTHQQLLLNKMCPNSKE